MKRISLPLTQTVLLFIASLLLALPAWSQSLTETLQKQIWSPTYVAADWEALLPGANQDTIFSADARWAEHVVQAEAGLPSVVTTLELVAGQWQQKTQTKATMDSEGRLVNLLSYQWDGEHWQNESWASHDQGTFQMRYWVDGAWEKAYSTQQPLQAITSASLEP